VTASAARTVARAKPNQKSGYYQQGPTGIDAAFWQGGKKLKKQWCCNQADDKCSAPSNVARLWVQQTADDTADASDATVRQQQHGNRQTDQRTTGQGAIWSETDPVNCHFFAFFGFGQYSAYMVSSKASTF